MASLYLKDGWFYLSWGSGAEKQQKALGLRESERTRARGLKRKLEAEMAAEKSLGLGERRTYGGYRKGWLARREAQGADTAKDDCVRLALHTSELDPLRLEDVKPRHVTAVILGLRRKKKLAPRTIRHVFTAMHRMFEDAMLDELVLANPVKAPKGVLPPKMDADPMWRANAIFTRSEVERLISDPRVPEQRRLLYALLFCTGMRIGEAAALTWGAYDAEMEPLGRLSVGLSYNRKQKRVKGTKTDVPRQVPVHPVLAGMLAEWKLSGWGAYVGTLRAPGPEDLLLPSARGQHMRDPVVHANLLRDLAALEMRPRRTHDARRTFISLALSDKATRDVLKRITHGEPKGVFDLYATFTWEDLCEAMGRLNIRPRPLATPKLLNAASHKKGE